jgi:hypothetical protein
MFAAPSQYVGSQRCLTAASSIVKRTGGPEVPGTFDAAGRCLSFVAARGSTAGDYLCRYYGQMVPLAPVLPKVLSLYPGRKVVSAFGKFDTRINTLSFK